MSIEKLRKTYCLSNEEMGDILKRIRRGIESVLPDMDYSITFTRSDKITIRFGSISAEEAIDELNNT